MSDPTKEPSRKQIHEPTSDQMNDQTTHEMNEQTEVLLQQSGTHANVSQQLVPAANSEGAKVASNIKDCSSITNFFTFNKQLVAVPIIC